MSYMYVKILAFPPRKILMDSSQPNKRDQNFLFALHNFTILYIVLQYVYALVEQRRKNC